MKIRMKIKQFLVEGHSKRNNVECQKIHHGHSLASLAPGFNVNGIAPFST